ncbi:hypothetical protein TPA0910_14430 [Streptomyces hygroscopicus subsp. sporocinereus]|uniref:Integral membrane protein n=1 Tax=Streptomyces hygroscopicus TaxID=1912 RepID=A0ABQ3TUK2_STRHY|nr:hypothetical protein TPA0910_14430 [Streptomyces hygroscopicus]
MSEQRSVRNELSGNVGGSVVQSGAIHGDVVFTSPAAPMDPEVAETQRRWSERQRRILDEEAAQEAAQQRRFEDYVRVIHRKRGWNLWLLLVESLAVVLGYVRVVPSAAVVATLGILFGLISLSGWIYCSVLLWRARTGRTIPVPRRRWMW